MGVFIATVRITAPLPLAIFRESRENKKREDMKEITRKVMREKRENINISIPHIVNDAVAKALGVAGK